jgi:hypothetical protein
VTTIAHSSLQPLIDFDGVICDFNAGAALANGIHLEEQPTHWNWYRDYGVTDKQFWDNIKKYGVDFYNDMCPLYEWAHDLVNLLRPYGPLTFCTNGPKFPDGKIQLIEWLFPEADVILMTASKKHWLARPEFVLIDDKSENVKDFTGNNGRAILFPQPWNDGGKGRVTVDHVEYVKQKMAAIKYEEWKRTRIRNMTRSIISYGRNDDRR